MLHISCVKWIQLSFQNRSKKVTLPAQMLCSLLPKEKAETACSHKAHLQHFGPLALVTLFGAHPLLMLLCSCGLSSYCGTQWVVQMKWSIPRRMAQCRAEGGALPGSCVLCSWMAELFCRAANMMKCNLKSSEFQLVVFFFLDLLSTLLPSLLPLHKKHADICCSLAGKKKEWSGFSTVGSGVLALFCVFSFPHDMISLVTSSHRQFSALL